ncbi:FRG domain-containing protein [uncultured Fusobacterium sp.]|uniref:FRG domain-containing protein n=1 Tax=uncultured Fusobacterium sp. TaxID=159267 RepID=UPI0026285544|nr:FRG domain-containing protein [uncultured Fusobacterium sp.]
MDIIGYSEFKETIPYVTDENSEHNGKYRIENLRDFYTLVLTHKEFLMNNDDEQEELEEEFNVVLSADDENVKNKKIYYRGQSNEEWEIRCSLFRENLLLNEEKLNNEILNRKPNDFLNCNNSLEKLILMQHYGIPTRLIDVTTNPLVALYFACQGNPDKDGVVFIFEENVEYDINDENIVATFSYLKNNGTIQDFEKLLNKENIIYNDRTTIETILNKKYILINPKLNNPRIVAQHGLFLCCSNNSGQGNLDNLTPIKKRSFPIESSKRIIISHKAKLNLLKELEFLGIKKSVLFPELENHADELKEKFSIKEKKSDENNKQKEKDKNKDSKNKLTKDELKVKNLKKEIGNLSFDTLEKRKLLDSIDRDLYLFENKIAKLKNYIRRNEKMEKSIKEQLQELIESKIDK